MFQFGHVHFSHLQNTMPIKQFLVQSSHDITNKYVFPSKLALFAG